MRASIILGQTPLHKPHFCMWLWEHHTISILLPQLLTHFPQWLLSKFYPAVLLTAWWMPAFTSSLSIPSNTKESPNFSAYRKNKSVSHIIKGMLFSKRHSHLQLCFIKDKEILIVILSSLSRKLFWNKSKGILCLDVVVLQQPPDRWQLTELLQMFLLLLIKNAVQIVPTALKCYSQ